MICLIKDTVNIFRAKRYKEIFDAWGWRKNLPGEYAQWMARKAHKRKREDGKETVFRYGGLEWDKADAEKSATRFKKSHDGVESLCVCLISVAKYCKKKFINAFYSG